jgi:hypothetical protein
MKAYYIRQNRTETKMDDRNRKNDSIHIKVTINVRESKGQSIMDNPERLATYGTQDTGQKHSTTKQKVKKTKTRITVGEPRC